MTENLFVGSHKGTNKAFRDGWDRTFGKKEKDVTRYCTPTEHQQFSDAGYAVCPQCSSLIEPIIEDDHKI